MTKSTKELQKPRQSLRKPIKKPYFRPHLVEYGNVAKLTASGGSQLPIDGAALRKPGPP